MDCFSPCGLLLPFWLGKAMAALLRASVDSARFGFSLSAVTIPRFCCAIPSQRFILGISTLPLLLSHSWPAHLSHPGWKALGCHSRASEEGAINEAGNFVLLSKQTLQVRLCSCCGAPCAALAVSAPAAPKQLLQVLWLTELCSLGCAVSCVWLLKRLNLYSCSYKVHWEC